MIVNRTRRAGNAAVAPVAVARARILLVEPDEDTRAMYSEWFRRDWDVVEAVDGRDALAEALVRPPALVISELRLPFIDGHALCEILRRDRVTARVPILVVTSEGRPLDISRAKAAGASTVLVKPTAAEEVLAEARRLLAGAVPPADAAAPAGPVAIEMDRRPALPRRRNLSKSLARVWTTTPPWAPPSAVCPECDQLLTYRRSRVGGVNEQQREQWDCYVCPGACGTFEYRHRTRTIRGVETDGGSE